VRRVSFGWMLAYGAARLGIGVHDIFFNAVAGFYLGNHGLSYMAVGFLANERSFLGSLLQPAFGAISDRIRTPIGRRRPFMLLGAPVAVLCFLLLALNPPTWAVVVIFIVGPFFLGIAVTPYLALLPDNVVPEQRGAVSGVNVLLAFVGGVGLLLAASRLWEGHPQLIFLIVAATLAVGFAITLRLVDEPPVPAAEAPSGPLRLRPSEYLRDILGFREAAKYMACYFFFWVGMGGITPFITRFGHEEIGIPEGETFILLLAVMLSTLAFATPAGWAGDRFGKKPVTLVALLAFSLLIGIGSQAADVALITIVLALAGVAQAVTTVLAYPLFTEMVPHARMGELTGLSTMIWSLAQPLGATSFGLLADGTGTLRSVFVAASATMLVAAVILGTVRVPGAEHAPSV
jgi:Na+/melibiose symporter-like transporter